MARRRGLATALQTALSAAAGGLGGYAQQQEIKKRDLATRQAQERQQALDVLNLQERGYVTPEQYAQQREGAAARGGSTVSRALMSALSPMAGAPPVAQVTGEDVSALSRALAMPTQPVQRVALGGQEFVRGETPMEREERLTGLEVQRQAMAAREAQRARLEERNLEIQAQKIREEEERRFTKERDAANRSFEAAQRSLDRASRTGGAPRPPTAEQDKNYLFAKQMEEAVPIIEQFGPTADLNKITAVLATDNPLLLAALNRRLTADEQQLVAAIREFSEPILRKATGAAFSPAEIRWVEQQVVPLSGDSEATIRNKTLRRQSRLGSFKMLALPAQLYYNSIIGAQTNASAGASAGASASTSATRQSGTASTGTRPALPYSPEED